MVLFCLWIEVAEGLEVVVASGSEKAGLGGEFEAAWRGERVGSASVPPPGTGLREIGDGVEDAAGDAARERGWEEMFRGDPVAVKGEVGGGGVSQFKMGFDFSTEVIYDDNVLYSRRGEEVADVIFRFRPGLFFALGDAVVREASFAKLSYRPTASVFMDLGGENSFNHDLGVEYGHRGSKLEATFDAGYRTFSDATVDVSQRTDRQVFDVGLLMEYALGAKTGMRGDAGYVVEDYDVFAGYAEWRGDVYLTYDVRPKTTLGIGYGVGELSPEAGDAQRYQRALLRGDWRATKKLALAAWGGADFRRAGDRSETVGVYGVEFGGRVREGTGLRLNLVRDIGASALLSGISYVRTVLSVGIDQRLGDRFTALLDIGYEDYDYDSFGDGDGDGDRGGRADKSWFVRPGIRYRLREELSAEVYYAYRTNDSSVDLFDFKKNQIGASVRYEF